MTVTPGQDDPRRSWAFGLAALAVLGGFGAVSGACSRLAHHPVLRSGHGSAFWLAAAGCLAVVVMAYGVVWPRGTEDLGRPRTPWSLLFGAVWGLTQGVVFLGVFELAGADVLVTIVVASAFQGLWHALFWDRRVSPAHNDPAWDARKVAFAHTPHLVASTVFLGVWGEPWVFVGLQVLVLVQCCRVMRFPAPTAGAGGH